MSKTTQETKMVAVRISPNTDNYQYGEVVLREIRNYFVTYTTIEVSEQSDDMILILAEPEIVKKGIKNIDHLNNLSKIHGEPPIQFREMNI